MHYTPIDNAVESNVDFDKDADDIHPKLRRKWNKVIKYVRHKVDQSRKARGEKDKDWERYYQFWKSKQWASKRIPWKSYITINMVFATIETIVATMTDQNPKITLLPADLTQEDYVDTMQAMIDTIWRRREVTSTIQEVIRNSCVFGTGFFKVFWDPEIEGGKGDVNITSIPPWCIYVDPCAKDTQFDNCEWVCQTEWVSLNYIKRRFPEYASLVKPTGTSKIKKFEKGGPSGINMVGSSGPMVKSPVFDRVEVIGNTLFSNPGVYGKEIDTDDYLLMEMWFKDDEAICVEEEVEIIDPLTGEVGLDKRLIHKDKYPNGRLVVVCNNVVLEDMPNPYQGKFWPFVKLVDNADIAEFWGIGEIELLEDLQRELNKRRSQIIDAANLTGNPVIIMDKDSDVDTDAISNKPGGIIRKRRGTEVKREAPPALPSYFFQMGEITNRDIQTISGIGDILGGLVPKGIRSGSGLSEAQDIASTRVRLKVKQLERSLSQIGKILIRLLQQYYTSDRVVSILGANGRVQWLPWNGNIRGDWDFIVGEGSMLPVSKSARAALMKELFQMGAIDQQALLKECDVPDYEDIIRRMGGQVTPVARQIPIGRIGGPPPKTDNSPSRVTGKSAAARDTMSVTDPLFNGDGSMKNL